MLDRDPILGALPTPPPPLPEPARGDDLAHRGRHLALERRALRDVAEPPPRVEPVGLLAEQLDRARTRGQRAQKHVEQGGLAGSVRTDQRDELTGPDCQGDVLDHRLAAVAGGHAVGSDQREVEPHVGLSHEGPCEVRMIPIARHKLRRDRATRQVSRGAGRSDRSDERRRRARARRVPRRSDARSNPVDRARAATPADGCARKHVDHAAADLTHRALEAAPAFGPAARARGPPVGIGRRRRADTRRIGASRGSAPGRGPSAPGSSDPGRRGPPSRSATASTSPDGTVRRLATERDARDDPPHVHVDRGDGHAARDRGHRRGRVRPDAREAPATPPDRSAPGRGARRRPPAPHDAATPRGGCSRAPPTRAARRPAWRAPALARWGTRA